MRDVRRVAWLENDADAARVRNAFEQGVLNAASIGFMPQKWEDIEGTYGRRYTKWQLLEWSIVPVPSNPDAIRTLKSLGLSPGKRVADDDKDILILDDEEIPDEMVSGIWRDYSVGGRSVTRRSVKNALLAHGRPSAPSFDASSSRFYPGSMSIWTLSRIRCLLVRFVSDTSRSSSLNSAQTPE